MRIIKLALGIAIMHTSNVSAQDQSIELRLNNAELKLQEAKSVVDDIKQEIEAIKLERCRYLVGKFALPATNATEEIVWHAAMALVYSEPHEQAKWVAHIITPDVSTGNFGRTNVFMVDSSIKTGSAEEKDYFLRIEKPDGKLGFDGFGFDRGHLAPSADFRWSSKALAESYYYSNMTPQRPDFNRISWAKLEDFLRAYVDVNQTELYVTTGPVLHDKLPKIERSINQVSIPEYHYKTAVDLTNNRAIAFIMPNRLCEKPLEDYAVTIDSVEALTGLNLYSVLEPTLQAKLEAQKDILPWFSSKESGSVAPLDPIKLPRKHFNTKQAEIYKGKPDIIHVCGKVVSARQSAKGHVFLNLDRAQPHQVFTVTIFKDNLKNFSYLPSDFLKGKTICVRGKVGEFNGVPSMTIENEAAIELYQP